MREAFEDTYADILNKAIKGRGLAPSDVAKAIGMEPEDFRSLRMGEAPDEDALRAAAGALGLDAVALVRLAATPSRIPAPLPPCVRRLRHEHDGLAVNSGIAWCPRTLEAAVFDTGFDPAPTLRTIEREGLVPRYIFITHTHHDHVTAAPELLRRTGARPICSALEWKDPAGSVQAADGDTWALGSLTVHALATPGHSAGGMSYLVEGLDKPVAFTGDALFASSMGGAAAGSAWVAALQSLRRLLALAPETVLVPGHGPVTTVADERRDNPFAVSDSRKPKADQG